MKERERERERFAIGFLIHRFSLNYREVCLNDGVRGDERDIAEIKGVLSELQGDSRG